MSGSLGPLKTQASARWQSPGVRALAFPDRATLGWRALAGAALLSCARGGPARCAARRASTDRRQRPPACPVLAPRPPRSGDSGTLSFRVSRACRPPRAAPSRRCSAPATPPTGSAPRPAGFRPSTARSACACASTAPGARRLGRAARSPSAPHAPRRGSRQALTGIAPRASANRVTYARGPISEWYVNGPLGLEQGFTIAVRRLASARRRR